MSWNKKPNLDNIDEFYKDWKNEVISWNAGGTVDDYDESLTPEENIENINKVEKGSRASLGIDDSIEAYRKFISVVRCNIENHRVTEICQHCKSILGAFDKDMNYTCECGERWNPLRLMYRGI